MAEEAKEKPKGKSKMLIIIIAAVVLLGGGGAASFLLLGGGKSAQAESAVDEKGGHGEKKGGGEGHGGHEAAGEALVTFEPFVVNLSDPQGNRFLKASIQAIIADPALAEQAGKDELVRSRLRDRIISVLTSKSFEMVTDPNGKENLRQQLIRELNQVLPDDAVKEILFVDFVVQ